MPIEWVISYFKKLFDYMDYKGGSLQIMMSSLLASFGENYGNFYTLKYT